MKFKFLLVGKTGNGKSTVANVLCDGKNVFVEGEYGVSQTKSHQVETVAAGDHEFVVIDTIGIGDTQLSTQAVLYKIAEACKACEDGINQVLFVTGGKFTKEEQFAWDIMRSALFDNDILRFTTIVRTRFTGFRDAEKRQRDIQLLKNENDELRKILESCRSVIHMNNLTADEDPSQQSRKDGGTVLRTYLYTCKDRYLPPNLSQLNEKVGRYISEKDRLQQQLEDLNQQVAVTKDDMVKIKSERDRLQGQIEGIKETVAKKTAEHVEEKRPGIFQKIGGILDDVVFRGPVDCSIM